MVLSFDFLPMHAVCQKSSLHLLALYVLCYSVNVCVCVSSTPEQEQLMVMWLSWMIKEEEYFER